MRAVRRSCRNRRPFDRRLLALLSACALMVLPAASARAYWFAFGPDGGAPPLVTLDGMGVIAEAGVLAPGTYTFALGEDVAVPADAGSEAYASRASVRLTLDGSAFPLPDVPGGGAGDVRVVRASAADSAAGVAPVAVERAAAPGQTPFVAEGRAAVPGAGAYAWQGSILDLRPGRTYVSVDAAVSVSKGDGATGGPAGTAEAAAFAGASWTFQVTAPTPYRLDGTLGAGGDSVESPLEPASGSAAGVVNGAPSGAWYAQSAAQAPGSVGTRYTRLGEGRLAAFTVADVPDDGGGGDGGAEEGAQGYFLMAEGYLLGHYRAGQRVDFEALLGHPVDSFHLIPAAPDGSLGSASDDEEVAPLRLEFDRALTELDVRPLLGGDANLDGRVDAADYHALDRGAALGLYGWAAGDFNFSDSIDADDYLLADRGFLATVAGTAAGASTPLPAALPAAGPASSSSSAAAVPEPAGLLALLAGAPLALLARRRRRKAAGGR